MTAEDREGVRVYRDATDAEVSLLEGFRVLCMLNGVGGSENRVTGEWWYRYQYSYTDDAHYICATREMDNDEVRAWIRTIYAKPHRYRPGAPGGLCAFCEQSEQAGPHDH